MSVSQWSDGDAGIRQLLDQFKHLPTARCFRPEAGDYESFVREFDPTTRFRGTTYEELAAYVFEATGLTEERFNTEGYKTLEDLLKECVDYDVLLIRRRRDGQLFRFASNARAEIILPGPSFGFSLQEVRREFPKSGKPPIIHETPKRHGCSETIKRLDEEAIDAMIRGLREEGFGRFERRDLIPIRQGEKPKIGWSSVYPGIMSFVRSWLFALYLEKKRWPDGRIIIDGNARIVDEWRPFVPW